jgi:hypothetical protein
VKFFDEKEEVLDIQLTQFGKHLLSVGKWKPIYYAFFDDNILYDGKFAGLVEEQSYIESRIQDDTPRLHTQHVFSGRETDYIRVLEEKEGTDPQKEEKVSLQSTPEKDYSLVSPLGTSELGNQKAPRWSIKALAGNIDSSSKFLTGSFQNLKIPQLDMQITYETTVRNMSDFPKGTETFGQIEAEELNIGVFADQTFFEVSGDPFLLEIEELNSNFDVENFDIEVFKFELEKLPGEKNSTVEVLNQLFFEKRKPQIKNNILVDDRPDDQIIPLDPSYVEYYFDVFVDDEISESIICSAIKEMKSKGIYVDDSYQCPEVPLDATARNPYEASAETTLVYCPDDDPELPPRASVVPSNLFGSINKRDDGEKG